MRSWLSSQKQRSKRVSERIKGPDKIGRVEFGRSGIPNPRPSLHSKRWQGLAVRFITDRGGETNVLAGSRYLSTRGPHLKACGTLTEFALGQALISRWTTSSRQSHGQIVMNFKPVIIIATALALSACAAAQPPAKGNAKGRVLKWFATNAKAVHDEADRHCKQYGKLARITEMRTDAGGRVLFECT